MAELYFQLETKYGRFSDTIWFSEEAPMSDEEIEAEKRRRVTNWIALIETPFQDPVTPEEPPLEPEE